MSTNFKYSKIKCGRATPIIPMAIAEIITGLDWPSKIKTKTKEPIIVAPIAGSKYLFCLNNIIISICLVLQWRNPLGDYYECSSKYWYAYSNNQQINNF